MSAHPPPVPPAQHSPHEGHTPAEEASGYCATIWMRKSDNQGENL
jgi:hypothetical protein